MSTSTRLSLDLRLYLYTSADPLHFLAIICSCLCAYTLKFEISFHRLKCLVSKTLSNLNGIRNMCMYVSYNALVFGLRMTLTALFSDSFGP